MRLVGKRAAIRQQNGITIYGKIIAESDESITIEEDEDDYYEACGPYEILWEGIEYLHVTINQP